MHDPTHGLNPQVQGFAREHYNRIRDQGRAYTAEEMSTLLRQAGSAPQTSPRNVERCARWIRTRNIGLNPRAVEELPSSVRGKALTYVKENRQRLGTYFDGHDDKIWVRRLGPLDRWDSQAPRNAPEGVGLTLDALTNMNRSQPGTGVAEQLKYRKQAQNTQSAVSNYSGKDLVTFVHEVGHSVHYRGSNYGTGAFVTTVNGRLKRIDPTSNEFQSQLRQVNTIYGQTNEREAFAEAHVSYVFAGKRLLQQAPLVHAWIEYTYDQAFENQKRGAIR